MAIFENPANGYREKAGGGAAWLWVLLFGGLYLAFNGLWAVFVFWVVAVCAAGWIMPEFGVIVGLALNFIFAFTISGMIERKYLRQGWRKVEERPLAKKEADAPYAGLARLLFGPGASDGDG